MGMTGIDKKQIDMFYAETDVCKFRKTVSVERRSDKVTDVNNSGDRLLVLGHQGTQKES